MKTIYLTLAVNPDGGVDIAASDPTLAGARVGDCQHMDTLRRMAWDVMAAARIRGARVGGEVVAPRANPVLLLSLAKALLDPEAFGHAVTAEVRDMARLALGGKATEGPLAQRSQPSIQATAKATAAAWTDWSAA